MFRRSKLEQRKKEEKRELEREVLLYYDSMVLQIFRETFAVCSLCMGDFSCIREDINFKT